MLRLFILIARWCLVLIVRSFKLKFVLKGLIIMAESVQYITNKDKEIIGVFLDLETYH